MWTVVLVVVGVLVAIIVILVALASMQPADFRISRSATMAAPAGEVFGQINDFHKWEGWSPWAKLDPTMQTTYEGAPAGSGAIYSWTGNNKVGSGRMTILESKPDSLIRIKLEFLRPFKATNTGEFELAGKGNQTEVTWSMIGRKNFMLKIFGVFMSMDKMVGGDFERGLASMKGIVEGTAKSR